MRNMPAVLVVEDEPAIAELIAVNLRHNGFRTTWAIDSASAQREIDAAVPDLILLDWMLPKVSGIEVYTRAAASRPEIAACFVFMTGGTFTAHTRAFLETTSNERVDKPFDLDGLRSVVRDRIARAR